MQENTTPIATIHAPKSTAETRHPIPACYAGAKTQMFGLVIVKTSEAVSDPAGINANQDRSPEFHPARFCIPFPTEARVFRDLIIRRRDGLADPVGGFGHHPVQAYSRRPPWSFRHGI